MRGPLVGSMYFHRPSRNASAPACSTTWSRPVASSPSRAASWLRLSGASPLGTACPVSAASDASRSTCETSACETPGFIRDGHRTTNGTRVPASKRLYLPPRNGPAGLCAPSFSTAWST